MDEYDGQAWRTCAARANRKRPFRWTSKNTLRWMTPEERERALLQGQRLSVFEPPLCAEDLDGELWR